MHPILEGGCMGASVDLIFRSGGGVRVYGVRRLSFTLPLTRFAKSLVKIS
jgi:hypothetical protein